MSGERPLRGGCHCGRNRYIVSVPQGGVRDAQVLFNTEPHHQVPLATPLVAYIRVPLSWYHSTTYAFFPDETHSMIRRVYTHPSHDYSKRHFCGFCGTPLSYWSEQPPSEADFINLTIGSLLREDLQDLEDMGLLPEEGDEGSNEQTAEGAEASGDVGTSAQSTALRQSFGVPWFDGLVEGTRLGNMRRMRGTKRLRDGQVHLEWEIVEFTDPGEGGQEQDEEEMEAAYSGKRKLEDRGE
ncbi:hypothetical protein ESCO_003115 [Escovopsis weberi]|uniref:CENP-V/GFA domain-containing protein n=1 Tax=Escovopsis weberi TaxID=150374 RepID=A0A0M9VSR6_ESCWE|nr:hypothetical protein ESCO_003115 [Escovopsis weberi]